jgi:hypothetical protein
MDCHGQTPVQTSAVLLELQLLLAVHQQRNCYQQEVVLLLLLLLLLPAVQVPGLQ